MIAMELDMIDRTSDVARVDDKPVFGIGFSYEFLSDQFPYERTCAIRPNQVFRHDETSPTVFFLDFGYNTVFPIDEIYEACTKPDVNIVKLAKSVSKPTLQIRLIERNQFWMAVNAARRCGARKLTEER